MVALAQRRVTPALERIDAALALAPQRADYWAQRARCLALLFREDDARLSVDRAVALAPEDALTLDTLGVVMSRLNDQARAAQLFGAAVERNPRHAGHAFNLASALRFLGDFDGAEAAYEAALAVDPCCYRAHWALATLRRQRPEHNHLARLEAMLEAGGADVDGELFLRHALAKEYEDLGQLETAFGHLALGKGRKRAALGYTLEDERRTFAALLRHFPTVSLTAAAGGVVGRAPIFVVGMPRTGTTLVERILSSHPDVTSAGELPDFPLCVKQLAGTRTRALFDAETVAASARIDPNALRAAYLTRVQRVAGTTPRFVDKLPLNFLYLGLIQRALPEARIICLRRHPMDACLSNYRQLFGPESPQYAYAYDLGDLAAYYALFDGLLRHWARILPGAVHEQSYEALVTDQVGETRRLLEFCGLGWDPRCLAFEANEAPVATASAVQVREPLHGASIGRWRRYGALLQPLEESLRAAGIAVD